MNLLDHLLIASNLLTFCCYGLDKWKAVHQKKRISEKTLHFLAFCGASPSALLAMFMFRHKTSKPKFYRITYLILALHLVGLILLHPSSPFKLLPLKP